MKNRGRKYLLLISSLFILTSGFSTPSPEQVVPIIKDIKPYSWYMEQSKLWEKETGNNPKNADAWLNYYTATQMARITCNKDNPFDKEGELVNSIVSKMEKSIPNTFEYHYIKWWNGNNNYELFHHLEKAEELDPNRPELFDDYVTYYELTRDLGKKREYCKKWFNSNDISPGVLAYNYNVLMSLENNSMLITNGDNDTYPIWILQDAQDIRKDVTILNRSLMNDKTYRTKIFEENGVQLPEQEFSEASTLDDRNRILYESIANNQKGKSLYFALTVNQNLTNQFSDQLYVVGLASQYNEQRMDNMAKLKKNFERTFILDHLKIKLYNDNDNTIVKLINLNYITPLLILHDHYKSSDDLTNSDLTKNLILKIAKQGGREEEIINYLESKEGFPANYKPLIDLSFKDLNKAPIKIKENLYVSQSELSNSEYELFLMDLLKQKEFEKLNMAQIHPVNWREFLSDEDKNQPDEIIFVHGKPDKEFHPVQNITHEAAIMYCEWLTKVYNSFDDKKKDFKKIKFRLPTEEEWELAAKGGEMKGKYPWHVGSKKIEYNYDLPYNSKGCYLANFSTTEDPGTDGGFFTVPVTSYWPNDYGLYNVIGNVSEMIDETGKAKGGSWDVIPEESLIKSVQDYKDHDPRVGFRVFMEIIER
ncbi:MAG: SUMF1/EgtB/PvdO family nonheme iron enzyme [Bacteroidia bacterium]|nr:SUMF1/EgtB/PvdO family nonheme iron enzyme [Bacteroidia bacterium]